VARSSDAIVLGRPILKLRDEDREAVAELLAELLIAELEREREGAA
jgi:hypothetical protein